MFGQIGKGLRLSKIFAEDGKALIVGLDSVFTLGVIENILEMRRALTRVLKLAPDAIVLNKGQIVRSEGLIGDRKGPALLLMADFTNAIRSTSFILPHKKLEHVKLASPKEAGALGVEGIVAHLLVGYEDEEARSIKIVSSLIAGCKRLGIPVLIESTAIGERVTEANRIDCLRLAVRMAVESGADIVATPYAGDEASVRSVIEVMGRIPLLAIDDPGRPLKELKNAISAGCAGLVLRDRLASGNIEEIVTEARSLVHGY